MTAHRGQRKTNGYWARARRVLAYSGVFAAVVAVMAAAAVARAGVATTERTVMDWRTGLAISGYDPVAYFVDSAAMQGDAEFEYVFAGTTWRFRNSGNRAAFVARPDVYQPRFGGYDPVQAARGVAVAGNPTIWLIHVNRLYLFYDGQARSSFIADPNRYLAAAERKWPAILRELVP